MLRKISAAIVFTMFFIIAATTAVYAGPYDSVFSGATFSDFIEYDKSDVLAYQMRGFCASSDGKYLFGGLLQSERRVLKIDAANGEILGEYADAEPGYPKGLATDDRGYLYVGIANAPNDGAIGFSIVEISTMNEVKFVSTEIAGKVGVNGVAVAKLGDKYYLYVIANYDTDRLYRWDVTNPSNPVLDSGFGKSSGYTDLQELTGSPDCDANYLAVGSDGIIYMTAKVAGGSKGDTILKISADGKSIASKASLVEPYGIYLHDDTYVLVSTYNSFDSMVYVLNASDLSTVAEIAKVGDASAFSGVAIAGNKIYVADQGYGLGDRILVSNVLEFPQPEPEPLPVEETAPADEEAPVTTSTETAPVVAAAKTGDSSIMVFSVLTCAAAAALFIFRRKK